MKKKPMKMVTEKNNLAMAFPGFNSKSFIISGAKIGLRDKRLSDARDDFNWQVDPELARLDAGPSLDISFSGYLLDYTYQFGKSNPSRRIFAVDTLDGKHIGNCSYYNIDESRQQAELGIMIGAREYWGKGYGADTVATLLNYTFSRLRLELVYLKTLDWNYRAQKCFKKCGFMLCGYLFQDGYSFLRMHISREQWEMRRNEASNSSLLCESL